MGYIKKLIATSAAGVGGALLVALPASALVQTADIAGGAVTTAKIANSGVTTVKLRDNSVTTQKLRDNSVTSAKIADGVVQTADLASGAVTSAKLGTNIAVSGTLDVTGKTTLAGSLEQKFGTDIASATALPLSAAVGNVFNVTGTTAITSATVAAGDNGRVVTLIFASTPTFTDGNNLKIAGNLSATADDTITLVSNGTNWYEVARSVN